MSTRIDATLPDALGSKVVSMAEELGVSRSEFVVEALSFFARVMTDARRGSRFIIRTPAAQDVELTTPLLSSIEWTRDPEALELPALAVAKMMARVEKPSPPTERLLAAAKRRKK